MRRRQWIVRRTMQQDPDGQRRWDRAYQALLTWSSAASVDEAPGAEVRDPPSVEVHDENCPIHASRRSVRRKPRPWSSN